LNAARIKRGGSRPAVIIPLGPIILRKSRRRRQARRNEWTLIGITLGLVTFLFLCLHHAVEAPHYTALASNPDRTHVSNSW
jgi:hypothetical protein